MDNWKPNNMKMLSVLVIIMLPVAYKQDWHITEGCSSS